MTLHLRIRNPIDHVARLSGAVAAVAALSLPFVAGCEDEGPVVVNTPPFPPDGVFSVTGDGVVSIYWLDNWESDLAGYRVYRSTTEPGPYTPIGEVPASQTYFDDTDVINGETWFYAVTAFDQAGYESDLSRESVFDTPRPEGFDLVLFALGQDPLRAGYDFASLTGVAQAWNAGSTDIYFETTGSLNFIRTRSGVDIQDYGVIKLVAVDWAPDTGWAPSGSAEAIVGHSYIVRIVNGQGDSNWAKFFVRGFGAGTVTLDWAYQAVPNNPELTPVGGALQ